MRLIPIIGLEVHAQLKTASKMFCACPNQRTDAPINTTICTICTAQPGALPMPNRQAIVFAVRAGLALGCTLNSPTKFDRKNYFYPDLPKGYQITQYDRPVAENGSLRIMVGEGQEWHERVIGVTRLHIEEDAAKSWHQGDKTVVDFNRAGSPLIEIVSEPDMHSAAEAKAYMQELRLVLTYLDVSDAEMENGQLRCDVNVSLVPEEEYDATTGRPRQFYPKTEVKNINSFRAVERAVQFEIERQTQLWEAGTIPMVTTTRGWDDQAQVTREQRTKEAAHDYRYFPEPDIPPFSLDAIVAQTRLPELPAARRTRFMTEYGFTAADAVQFSADEALGSYAEQVYSEYCTMVKGEEVAETARRISGWVLSRLIGRLRDRAEDISQFAARVSAENFAEFLALIANNKITNTNAQKLLDLLIENGGDPDVLMEQNGLAQNQDTGAVADIVARVLAASPAQVAQYRAGKVALMGYFVGQCMRAAAGTVDATALQDELVRQLAS
ncbi:MAG: Asp-tRNA(Asn)/Glu-tRNA(Gln) amidotransferase subunit GatB [Patescibacteria group bacterium]